MIILPMLSALIIGLIGAELFNLIGLPMPWMLGPLLAVLSVRLLTPLPLQWHPVFRNIGLVIAGYVIGFSFTLEAIQGMIQYFPIMLVINIVFFLLFLLISFLMARRTRMDRGTAMTCCVPGGLQQIVVFAEEEKHINLSAVTFYHVLRVLMIVTVVPFIVTSEQQAMVVDEEVGVYSIYLIGILILCYFVGMLSKKIRVPTAYLLGPVFLIMCFNIAKVEVPVMPSSLLHIAQLVIGIYIGLLLKKETIKISKKNIFYAFFSSGVLILVAFGISLLLQRQGDLSFSTSFLSVVPGGLDQMGIIAASVQADVTIVTAFQLFRILFLSVFIVPFVKYMVSKERRGEHLESEG